MLLSAAELGYNGTPCHRHFCLAFSLSCAVVTCIAVSVMELLIKELDAVLLRDALSVMIWIWCYMPRGVPKQTVAW